MTVITKTIRVVTCDLCESEYDDEKTRGMRLCLTNGDGSPGSMPWKDLCPECLGEIDALLRRLRLTLREEV